MIRTGNALRRFIARRRLQQPVQSIAPALLGTSFASGSGPRILIYHTQSAICWSQIYPYFHYADAFADRHGAQIRALPVERFLAGTPGPAADVIIVQPWFTTNPDQIGQAFATCRKQNPKARIMFLDGYAHIDLRLGRQVDPHIDLYQRKALFRDRSQFLHAFAGDTNLTEYYSALYDLKADPTDWQTPPALLDRLTLAPNFLTMPYLVDGFLGPEPTFTDRTIDLHSRIAIKGTPWYSAMRNHADQAAKAIGGIRMTPPGRIDHRDFMTEMRRSRLCWSPFGYGELCWRDCEAFMTGAVLVKPDMSHLETQPDLYLPGETYLPVKWDFSDLEQVVRDALADPARCEKIARNAFGVARDYLASGRFVTDAARDLQLN